MNMSYIEAENRKRLLNIINKIPSGVPDGWEKVTFAVSGLMYIGFSNVCTEKLIVISSQGQRIINCRTGEKTYCDENYDEGDLIAFAEEFVDEVILLAGEGGGGLRRYSEDGNILESIAPAWPIEKVIFMPNYVSWHQNPDKCTLIFEDYEIRAFGFSKCGNYMAVCNSNTLDIFRKK